MYCSECGKEIPDDSKFCEFCGADLASQLEAGGGSLVKEEAGGEGPIPGGEPSSIKGKIKPALILAVAVIIVIIALVASPSLMKNIPGFQMPFSQQTISPTTTTLKSTPHPTGSPITTTTYAPTTTIPTTQVTLSPYTYGAKYPPSVAFSANPIRGQAPLDVKFIDSSENFPTSWQWSFGDGGGSTEQNPTHRYYSEGSYTVTLVAQNSKGIDQSTRTGYITVTGPVTIAPSTTTPMISAPPTTTVILPPTLVPDWSIKPNAGTAPLSVHFTDLSKGSPTYWLWTFGDGTSSNEQNPTHTYTNPGSYSVTFATGTQWQELGMGIIGTIVVTAPVTSAPPTTPPTSIPTTSQVAPIEAKMSYEPNYGSAPLTVHFTDLSTGSPTSWYWDFGDGSTSTMRNPVHIYTTEGTFTPSLSVTNSISSSILSGIFDPIEVVGPGGVVIVTITYPN